MFFNNKCNTFFGLNLTLVYTFPMCMAWRFHFPIRNYDFKRDVKKAGEEEDGKKKTRYRGGWKRLSDEAVKKLRSAPHP